MLATACIAVIYSTHGLGYLPHNISHNPLLLAAYCKQWWVAIAVARHFLPRKETVQSRPISLFPGYESKPYTEAVKNIFRLGFEN